jgi:hypothetical protein
MTFYIWRIGWLRKGATPSLGWRHLFFRLWWKYIPQPAGLPQVSVPPYGLVPMSTLAKIGREPMHWAVDGGGYPYCGEVVGGLWTVDLSVATCLSCREQGFGVVLQWEVSNR